MSRPALPDLPELVRVLGVIPPTELEVKKLELYLTTAFCFGLLLACTRFRP